MTDPVHVLGCAAAGFATNVAAVHLVTLGLIPLEKERLARELGAAVARKILTPQGIAEELVAFMKAALSDPETVRRGRSWLMRAMQKLLPAVIDMLRPELMPGMRRRVAEDISRVPVSRAVGTLVEAWFSDERNREVTARLLVGIMKENREGVVDLLQRGLKRYAKKVDVSGFGLEMVEAMEILDWEDFSDALVEHLDSPRGLETAHGIVARIPRTMRPYFEELVGAEWLGQSMHDASLAAIDLAEAMPAERVAELLSHGVASDELLHFVRYGVVPNLTADLAAILRTAAPEELVAAKVADALRGMPAGRLAKIAGGVALRTAPLLHVLGGALGALSGVVTAFLS